MHNFKFLASAVTEIPGVHRKQHLDLFSHFCSETELTAWQTERLTDTTHIGNNRLHPCIACSLITNYAAFHSLDFNLIARGLQHLCMYGSSQDPAVMTMTTSNQQVLLRCPLDHGPYKPCCTKEPSDGSHITCKYSYSLTYGLTVQKSLKTWDS